MDLFHCKTISEINEHEEILSKLPKLEMAFINRISRLYCGGKYRTYHYLLEEKVALMTCMLSYMVIYQILTERMKAMDWLFNTIFILFPLIHFIYYTGIERNDEWMVWMTVYFPALVQILLKVVLFLISIFFRLIYFNNLFYDWLSFDNHLYLLL